MIYLQINDKRIEINPTIFPDKTSQIWNIEGFDNISSEDKVFIIWIFEHEAEYIWLLQLIDLLKIKLSRLKLVIPYMPYARQDKMVNNNLCFSLTTFMKVLTGAIGWNSGLYVLDIHSLGFHNVNYDLINTIPFDKIKSVINEKKINVVLYPDEGAFIRYNCCSSFLGSHCIKERDQQTGRIISLQIPAADFKNKRVLIVDDICDGGATFIEIARQLKEKQVASIDLYVTHGIFSKGKQILLDAGINEIHTADYWEFINSITEK